MDLLEEQPDPPLLPNQTATSSEQTSVPRPPDSPDSGEGDDKEADIYVRSCSGRITEFPTAGAVGPVFMDFADNDFLPKPNNPDHWANTIKMPLTVSGDAVGPVQIEVSPEEDIRLGYYEDEGRSWPAFEDMESKLRIEGCDDLTRWYVGGIVVRGPGCYTLSVTDLGTGEHFGREFPVGTVGCEGYPVRVATFPGGQFSRGIARTLTMGMVDDGLLATSSGVWKVDLVDLASGKKAWGTDRFPVEVGLLAIDDAKVYIAGSGLVMALDRNSGEEEWRVELSTDMAPLSGMLVDGVLHTVFSQSGGEGSDRLRVISVAPEDGTNLGETNLDDGAPKRATLVHSNRHVLVGTGHGLYAIGAASRELAWRIRVSAPKQSHSPHFVVNEGFVYVGDRHDQMAAIDIESSQTKWRTRAHGSAFPVGVIGDEFIFVDDERVHSVDVITGETVYIRNFRNVCAGRPECAQTATVDGNTIYLFQPRVVIALTTTGEFLWRRSVDERSPQTLTVLDGTLVVAAGEDAIHGLDSTTGAVEWMIPNGSIQPLYVHDDHLVVLHTGQTATVYDPWVP